MTAETPPPPSLVAVLTDPWLFRHITSFQYGLPVTLFEFWCEADATLSAAAREDRNLIHARHAELLTRILAHGGDATRLLDLFATVRHTDYDHRGFHWSAPQLDRVVHEAVASCRRDLAEWAIANETAMGFGRDVQRVWENALANVDNAATVVDALGLDDAVVARLAPRFRRRAP